MSKQMKIPRADDLLAELYSISGDDPLAQGKHEHIRTRALISIMRSLETIAENSERPDISYQAGVHTPIIINQPPQPRTGKGAAVDIDPENVTDTIIHLYNAGDRGMKNAELVKELELDPVEGWREVKAILQQLRKEGKAELWGQKRGEPGSFGKYRYYITKGVEPE